MKRYKPVIKNNSFEESEIGDWLKYEDVIKLIQNISNVNKEIAEKWIKIFS